MEKRSILEMSPLMQRFGNFKASPLLLSRCDQCWNCPPHVVAVG